MVSILKNNEKLTPYYFYSNFLKEVAISIKETEDINFKLVENGDDKLYDSNYRIEPITIPLLLSLIEQLSKFFKKPISLALYNNSATKKVLNFLYRSDFFYVAGNHNNPYFPAGKNILKFDNRYLGDFINQKIRPDHRVRCYSINDGNLIEKLKKCNNESEKRDFLISEYVYMVREHFQELLFDNVNTIEKVDIYIEILSELITNGVLHSKSNTFALMFVNKFSTKFSISDNGIGFTESLKTKVEDFLYKPLELKNRIDELKILNVNFTILENLNFIIETLYFSCLKNRRGLFDLLISVVLNSNGYFRLHSENSQIIISKRMATEIKELSVLRNELFDFHKLMLIENVTDKKYDGQMILIKDKIQVQFVNLYRNLCNKYNDDFKYSSIRFFNVKFRGVHIEVDIPNLKI